MIKVGKAAHLFVIFSFSFIVLKIFFRRASWYNVNEEHFVDPSMSVCPSVCVMFFYGLGNLLDPGVGALVTM